MKPNKCLFFLWIAVLVPASRISTFAQNTKAMIYPSVIGTAGGTHTGGKISLDWTLGEGFVEINRNVDHWYTEGFHQPQLVARQLSSSTRGYEFKIFPNPASELLNIFITAEVEETLNLKLMDVTGRIIFNQVVAPRTPAVQMILKHIPEGMYMLSIVNPGGYRIHSFKIMKL